MESVSFGERIMEESAAPSHTVYTWVQGLFSKRFPQYSALPAAQVLSIWLAPLLSRYCLPEPLSPILSESTGNRRNVFTDKMLEGTGFWKPSSDQFGSYQNRDIKAGSQPRLDGKATRFSTFPPTLLIHFWPHFHPFSFSVCRLFYRPPLPPAPP